MTFTFQTDMSETEERLSRGISAAPRRQMLRLLAEKEWTVKEIAQEIKQSVSLTSRHLTLLSDLGLVKVRKEAQHKYYSPTIKELKEFLILYDKIIDKL